MLRLGLCRSCHRVPFQDQARRLLQVAHVSVPVRGCAVRLDHPDLDKFFCGVPREPLRQQSQCSRGKDVAVECSCRVTCVDPGPHLSRVNAPGYLPVSLGGERGVNFQRRCQVGPSGR